jgi:hypothetical protein
MTERLDKLCLPPPPADTPWSNRPGESTSLKIERRDGLSVESELPLFWYDPPWYQLGTDTADVIAAAAARLGILVSALRSDLSGPDQQSDFHGDDPDPEEQDQEQGDAAPLPRIVPYRPERYGISDRDFDGARIIDVRLMMNRDPTGRFAFPPEQVQRWEATQPGAELDSGFPVPSASFPPDVVSMEHLSCKLDQLRALAPTAAVFVSLGPYRLDEELPAIVDAKPDGLILRLDELDLDGLKLALATRHACELIERVAAEMPLFIVPGEVTPDDAVKLLALGASAVAIDSWCGDIIAGAENDNRSSSTYGYSSRKSSDADLIELVDDELVARIDRFKGLASSLRYALPNDRLASSSETWGRALGLRSLSFSGVSGHSPAKHRKQ